MFIYLSPYSYIAQVDNWLNSGSLKRKYVEVPKAIDLTTTSTIKVGKASQQISAISYPSALAIRHANTRKNKNILIIFVLVGNEQTPQGATRELSSNC
ncbi:hypothetical protein NPIL_476191 [Nephila pilipes]|uniref:Uncharacterized protein n=1 Tax=Nephila pilipes TaxID=299642 RepID=A0A8X6Q3S8_NEPPI|nr:hypothetical protein NPIL_476191 [Nephila pilipes]